MKHLCCILLAIHATVVFAQDNFPEKQLAGCFFPKGRAIGQPFTSKQPHIRMVRVDSYSEALDFFKNICRFPGQLKTRENKGDIGYFYILPDKGYFLFTPKGIAGTNEVAILWIKVPFLVKQGVQEIHFVQTIKIKQKD